MRPLRALWLLGLLACEGEPRQETRPRSAAEQGRELFSSSSLSPSAINRYSCSTCHLASLAPPDDLLRPGYPLAGAVERPSYWGGQVDSLLDAVNDCRYYFMGINEAWQGQEREAQAVYAYLASLPPEAPGAQPFTVVQAAVDLPAGSSARGADLYRRACGYCHGAIDTGEGRTDEAAPVLPGEPADSFRKLYDFDQAQIRVAFIEKVRHGVFLGLYGRMPPFSRESLSDEQLADIAAFLRLYP